MPTDAAERRIDARLTRGRVRAVERDSIWLGLVLALASGGFALGLGSSSLFIDEAYSWNTSRGGLADISDNLRFGEVTPPLYYLLLHGWIQLGADSELLLRLPSALAGVGVVGAVWWLGGLVGGRRAGLIAGALAAVSPLLLVYAQQARAYVFVMLAVTLAVAAAVRATRDRSPRWLLLAGVAAALSVLLHYTALLVLVPLAVWVWRRPELERSRRLGFAAAIAVPLAALVPLALEQMSQGHHDSAGAYASLTMFNAVRLAGTPFDGRATGGLMAVRELAALIVVEALALLALAERFRTLRAGRLIATCGATPILAVLGVSAVGQPLALTRYTAVACPFALVAIAAVAVRLKKEVAAMLVVAALLVSGAGLVATQLPSGQNPDTRAAVQTVAAGWRSGDAVTSVGFLGFDGALGYYAERLLPPGEREVRPFPNLGAAARELRLEDRARLWLISDPVIGKAELRRELSRLGLRPVYAHVFDGNAPVQLVRAERVE